MIIAGTSASTRTSGKRGMGSDEDGMTSADGGPAAIMGKDSPPRFKSTGDVRRTLLVLLPENN